MNNRYGFASLAAGISLITGTLVWTGCETDSSTSKVVITPQSIVLKPGQTVQFTASGGYDYTWSLAPDDGSGTLNATKGESVIYTCMATNIGYMPKQVKVASTIEGASSGGASNSTPYVVEAFAEVYYPSGTSGSSSSTSTNTP